MIRLHASAVMMHDLGVLITGKSGAGKSSLCAELISRGAWLIADDQVELEGRDGRLFAHPPAALKGLIELYGIGVVECPALAESLPCPIAFEVRLSGQSPPDRLPEPQISCYEGCELPCFTLSGGVASVSLVAAKITLLAQIFQQFGRLCLVDVAKPPTTD